MLVFNYACTQNFEGTLTYTFDFELSEEMKNKGFTKEDLKQRLIDEKTFSEEVKYFYKDSNYIIETVNSTGTYLSLDNIIYSRNRGENIVVAINTKDNPIKVINTTIEETDLYILGVRCKKMIIETKHGEYEYFFNSDFLKMDASLYENYFYENFNTYLKVSNSLPFRIIKNINGNKTIMNLVNYEKKKINDSIFELPRMSLDESYSTYLNKIYIINE